MFIDPLTLFILGEIFVVYIIINIFLFFNGRLYKVLVALLKEMRFEKLRREQVKQAELAALRAKNKDLMVKNKVIAERAQSAGKSITEQLSERLESIAKQYPHSHDLQNSTELDQSAQWLRVRLLELEQELLSGNIDEAKWQELATEAISRVQVNQAEENANRQDKKDSAEDQRLTGELQNDLEENQRLYHEALVRVRHLEGELEEMRAINTPSENLIDEPKQGLYENDIYRLKCDNFDLNESINKLKLELQQSGVDLDADSLTGLLENQISNLEQYIKNSDITTGLMEKEITAAQNENKKLLEQLNAKGGSSKSSSPMDSLNNLSQNQNEQMASIDLLKGTIERIKSGEDPSEIALKQEQMVQRLEQILKESEMCITLLEQELLTSQKDVGQLKDELATKNLELINSNIGELSTIQEGQKTGVDTIKSLISEIQSGGDAETLLAKQEDEIGKLERFLSESDTLMAQLETEISDLQEKLIAAESNAPVSTSNKSSTKEVKRPDSDEDIEEMEKLLQQFISDMQSTLKVINKLQDENTSLKAKLSPTGKPMPKATASGEPEILTDVEAQYSSD